MTVERPSINDLDEIAQVVLDLFEDFERVDFTTKEIDYILVKASAINYDPDSKCDLTSAAVDISKNTILEER